MKFSDLKLTTPYLSLSSLFYDMAEPMPLENPFLITASQDAAKLLGVDENLYSDEKLLSIVNAQMQLENSRFFSMCYAGHQFGYFVERLGDGRAINLGKVNGQNLQLKGAGLTLYSRQGDGRAVLRSSVREFLMSEAMYGLGIETSRALALIGSETKVARERWESGAIVLRLSPTWIRFGTFEYFYAKGEYDKLQELADYVIAESFAELENAEGRYLKMYAKVVGNTARTVAKWQTYGFNHGVMNTDNMSIDGRTIDYGPFAFLDDYDANYICNHSDVEGRYSFKNQPGIAKWNLAQLARALSPIVSHEASLLVLDEMFSAVYEREYRSLIYGRMGLVETDAEDAQLMEWMLGALESSVIDYNGFFRKLSRYDGDKSPILDSCVYRAPLDEWLDAYTLRLEKEKLSQTQREKMMLQKNPKYILKNHLLQEAILKAERGEFRMVQELLKVALAPFDEHPELENLTKPTPEYAKNRKLSCSS